MELAVKYITAEDGVKIAYVDEGTGPVMIYQYGMGSSLDLSEEFVNQMKNFFRIIIFEIRGYGYTPYEGEISVPRIAKDLDCLIKELDLSDVILFGYSMGAAVVMSYVEQFGCDRLSKLIITDMSAKLIRDETWPYGLYQGNYTQEDADFDARDMEAGNYERWALTLIEQLMFTNSPENPRELRSSVEEIKARIAAKEHDPVIEQVLIAGMITMASEEKKKANMLYTASLGELDFRDMLKTITVPTALIYADPGSGYQPADAEYMHERIPESVLMPMKDCSHMCAMENPALLVQYVFGFCDIKIPGM